MNTATTRPIRHRPSKARLEPIWNRAEFTPVTSIIAIAAQPTHDFLVPNPRPDLIFDQRTLRMIETR